MTRRELREHVFRSLFGADFYRSGSDADEQLDLYFIHEGGDGVDYPPSAVPEEEREEVKERIRHVWEKQEEIDRMIDAVSIGWTTDRMSRADLAILRLGAYELLFDESVPPGVAINEAVLLAKKFGGEESSSFINGILGKLQRENADGPGAPKEDEGK